MFDSSSNHDALTPMFDLCRQVYPYLDGKIEACNSNSQERPNADQKSQIWLMGSAQDSYTIEAIANDIKQASPRAGQAYFMTRTWDLLCWQPMYIAFIAIYGLKQIPDFSTFKQKRQYNSVTGFTFQDSAVSSGEAEQLIPLATSQLKPLFEHYRIQLDALMRCRSGYVSRLVSDLVLANLLKVSHHFKHFTHQDLHRHATLWLDMMGLPKNHINALIFKDNQPLTHIRRSCCLTYKANNDLCANCPKQHKKQSS